MKAILLAAGLGTRLKPLTDTLPKCLVPICGRPLLGIWLENLKNANIESVLVNIHADAEMVKSYLDEKPFGIEVVQVYEKELLLTGGTVLANRSFFGREPVVVIHADNLCTFDIGEFIKIHQMRPKNTVITMMTFLTPTPESCGIVELDDLGIVRGFYEKVSNPPGNLANGAVYIFEPEVIEFMESLGKSKVDISTEVLPHFIGRIATCLNSDLHIDVGTPESYKLALLQMECRATSPDVAWGRLRGIVEGFEARLAIFSNQLSNT